MNVSGVIYCDIANGQGIRTSLFVSGCRNHCKGCFQPETWDFNNGILFTKQLQQEIIDSLKYDYVKGLTLLGGDPFEPENVKELYPFIKIIKDKYPEKNIWCYTGYTFNELILNDLARLLLIYIDVLVDGKFILEQKDVSLPFRGSKNQRIIDVQQSIKKGKIILYKLR